MRSEMRSTGRFPGLQELKSQENQGMGTDCRAAEKIDDGRNNGRLPQTEGENFKPD